MSTPRAPSALLIDSLPIARVMRNLAAMSSVREVGPDLYVHSRYSRALVTNPAVDAFKYMHVQLVAVPAAGVLIATQIRRLRQGLASNATMARRTGVEES